MSNEIEEKCPLLVNETVLIASVICSKKIKVIAHTKAELDICKGSKVQLVPDIGSTTINTSLLKDLIVIQGFIKGSVYIDDKCVDKIAIPIQEEIHCEGVCPGDMIRHTTPMLEGVLPPQFIPNHCAVFKVILSLQVTVVREKIGTISVNVIGDINEDRCKTETQNSAVFLPDTPEEKSFSGDCSCSCKCCRDQNFNDYSDKSNRSRFLEEK